MVYTGKIKIMIFLLTLNITLIQLLKKEEVQSFYTFQIKNINLQKDV